AANGSAGAVAAALSTVRRNHVPERKRGEFHVSLASSEIRETILEGPDAAGRLHVFEDDGSVDRKFQRRKSGRRRHSGLEQPGGGLVAFFARPDTAAFSECRLPTPVLERAAWFHRPRARRLGSRSYRVLFQRWTTGHLFRRQHQFFARRRAASELER